ncbi:hypothetical protein QE152_g31419 [Popillia japonica]|uniref:Uncharacterized protein n=1 Tax=Popillia japonica TaxID=7064 RepID=A0AAW1J1D1_POPJA
MLSAVHGRTASGRQRGGLGRIRADAAKSIGKGCSGTNKGGRGEIDCTPSTSGAIFNYTPRGDNFLPCGTPRVTYPGITLQVSLHGPPPPYATPYPSETAIIVVVFG